MMRTGQIKCDFKAMPVLCEEMLSTRDMERAIASITAIQIEALSLLIIGSMMQLLSIDVQNCSDVQIEGWEWLTVYNPHSKFMKWLLPICKEKITAAFANSLAFVEQGMVFEFWNADGRGLLNEVEDPLLRQQIIVGLKSAVKVYMRLKVKESNLFKLKMVQYRDGQRVASYSGPIQFFVDFADQHLV